MQQPVQQCPTDLNFNRWQRNPSSWRHAQETIFAPANCLLSAHSVAHEPSKIKNLITYMQGAKGTHEAVVKHSALVRRPLCSGMGQDKVIGEFAPFYVYAGVSYDLLQLHYCKSIVK